MANCTDNLTLGEIKELMALFGNKTIATNACSDGLNLLVGKKCIIRTYTAGVFFGEVIEKSGKEVIVKNARRLFYWKTKNKGISLSEVANGGLADDSKVCAPVESIWLEAIELIPCSQAAIKNIEGQNEYKA
jgi:hypothetical protein